MRTGSSFSVGRRRVMVIGAAIAVVALMSVLVFSLVQPAEEAESASRPADSRSVSTDASRTILSTKARPSAAVILPGSSPTDSRLIGGQTDHLQFGRLVARAVFAYDSNTDFQARNDDLLRAAAPSPYGDPEKLAQDLTAFTPAGPALDLLRKNDTIVTVDLTTVAVSGWAADRLKGIGVSPGVYGIDVTGSQMIITNSGNPTQVTVLLGITVACPPATTYCTLDRVLPQHLQDALGPG
jgi:hypothetical protein